VRIVVRSNDDEVVLVDKLVIGPDGKVKLGEYGGVYIAGLTLEQSQKAIEKHLLEQIDNPSVKLDVAVFNSKRIYVITKGSEAGDFVVPVPWTIEMNVLQALFATESSIGLDDRITIERPEGFDGKAAQCEVDLKAIARGDLATNHGLIPGDRIIVTLAAPAVDRDEAKPKPTSATSGTNNYDGPVRNSVRVQ
jgi:protein involved in polysaccharide export with SLBB domain